MKKKRSLQKDLLFLSITSFVVTAAWVGFNVFHTWVTTTITPEIQMQITPITPSFDTETINKLKARRTIFPANTITAKPTPQTEVNALEPQPTGQIPTETGVTQPTPITTIAPLNGE